MPRRLVTSEIWTNEKFGSLDLMGRLIFIGLITHADDDGRLKGSPNYLKAKIFPYDLDISPPKINEVLERCHELHLITRYNTNGSEYIYLIGWEEHQQIRADRHKPSTLPPPPDNLLPTIPQPTDNQPTTPCQPTTANCLHNIIEVNISKDNIKGETSKEVITPQDSKELISLNKDLKKHPELLEPRKEVFTGLKARRGYNSPKAMAEAKAINSMLKKEYTPELILKTWDILKADKFWQGKELFMMTVESQIGAVLKLGKIETKTDEYRHMVKT
jgi:hypothetical protein